MPATVLTLEEYYDYFSKVYTDFQKENIKSDIDDNKINNIASIVRKLQENKDIDGFMKLCRKYRNPFPDTLATLTIRHSGYLSAESIEKNIPSFVESFNTCDPYEVANMFCADASLTRQLTTFSKNQLKKKMISIGVEYTEDVQYFLDSKDREIMFLGHDLGTIEIAKKYSLEKHLYKRKAKNAAIKGLDAIFKQKDGFLIFIEMKVFFNTGGNQNTQIDDVEHTADINAPKVRGLGIVDGDPHLSNKVNRISKSANVVDHPRIFSLNDLTLEVLRAK